MPWRDASARRSLGRLTVGARQVTVGPWRRLQGAGMSYFEFQISVPRFLMAQRNFLRQLALCPPSVPAVNGVQIVVDRVDVGGSSMRHDEETKFSLFLDDHASTPC
jgi:hypothetical protein